MKVLDSNIASQVEATYCLKIGDFHFFKDFMVAEFNQGAYVSFSDLTDIYDLGFSFYADRPHGFISNRVNSYSIDLVDIYKNRRKLKFIHAYAIVTYSHNSKRMLAIEDYYFKKKRTRFNTLQDAINWVNEEITKASVTSNKSHLTWCL